MVTCKICEEEVLEEEVFYVDVKLKYYDLIEYKDMYVSEPMCRSCCENEFIRVSESLSSKLDVYKDNAHDKIGLFFEAYQTNTPIKLKIKNGSLFEKVYIISVQGSRSFMFSGRKENNDIFEYEYSFNDIEYFEVLKNVNKDNN